ncbi:putative Ig domain-containing protein [Myxococcus sp. Y35]|uniref:putative Ig domain-containing protein n=1 Tax=Pseudomyxococcus flavus TaxID=3115648 RepID=UPI003CEF468F
MFNHNHVLRALLGASLWWSAGCQSDAFVSHEGTVRSGASVPLSLQVHFGPGNSDGLDGQMVACIALPTGWQAPSGSYTYAGSAAVAAQVGSAELVSNAQAAWPVEGSTWHCLISERVTLGTEAAFATAQLSLPIPSVAQGAYRLRYQTGFRDTTPTDPPHRFTGRLERLLHVNVAPATTFDHWEAGTAMGTSETPSATRAWHGGGTFLATTSGSAEMLRSTDGLTWTGFTPVGEDTLTPIQLERMVYSQRKWFGLANGSIVVSSDNANTWVPLYEATPPPGGTARRSFLAIALSGNRLVAVGTAGLIASSPDGVTWTDESISSDYDLVTLATGQGSFLAVANPMAGAPSTVPALVRPRADSSGWELFEPSTLSGLPIPQLVGGNNRFLAFVANTEAPPPPALPSQTPAEGFFLSEDLGSTWTRVDRLQVPVDAPSAIPLVTFVDQSFVVSWTGTAPQGEAALPAFELWVSADGREWTSHLTGAGGTFTADAFATGETSVVAVNAQQLLKATRRPWPQPELLTESLPPFHVGTTYHVGLDARGSGTLTFELEGTLPPGLRLLPTGAFSGTPTQAGSTAVTVRARDARGGVAARTYSVDVVSDLSISGGALASATQGREYEARFTATGGRAPYTWSLAGGPLPGGMTIQQRDGAYVLSGIPTVSGTFPLTVRVTDAANRTAERSVSLQIVTPPPPTDDGGDSPSGCGCSGGGAGVQALGLAALALLGRVRRKR